MDSGCGKRDEYRCGFEVGLGMGDSAALTTVDSVDLRGTSSCTDLGTTVPTPLDVDASAYEGSWSSLRDGLGEVDILMFIGIPGGQDGVAQESPSINPIWGGAVTCNQTEFVEAHGSEVSPRSKERGDAPDSFSSAWKNSSRADISNRARSW